MTLYSSVGRPSLVYPEHRLDLPGMLALAERFYGDLPNYRVIERMIRNTAIAERRLAIDPARFDELSGLRRRTDLYMIHALPLARAATLAALSDAQLEPGDIDLLITISCTGFVMPGLDAYLMSDLDFRPTTRRLPIAQLGCVAGAAALVAANDHCRAFPSARVLIVAAELSSLCFFPERRDLTSAVCASIFGDGAAACVVSGGAFAPSGLRLGEAMSYTLPHAEHYIRYETLDGGFHLNLDRKVMHAVPGLAPIIRAFVDGQGVGAPDFVVAHTGGRRILDGLASSMGLTPTTLQPSRASLREYGNTASVSIFDVLGRVWDHEAGHGLARDTRGFVVAFGPGFTMILIEARWQAPDNPSPH